MNLRSLIFNLLQFSSKLKKIKPKTCILITGCDSGLGFNLALLCSKELKMTVISGCLNINSEGAKILKLEQPNIIPTHLDLLKHETINKTFDLVENLVSSGYNLAAIVNNAGIMCFGEFEWQTTEIFESQINVNLLGTMKLTHKFISLIRTEKSRIINVTSHCGLHSLPGLSIYSASKAGLKSWNDALRIEMSKYGVKVINFVPGSFVTFSNIAARQNIYANIMRNGFNLEQEEFYGNYFEKYFEYLTFISYYKSPCQMNNYDLFQKFKLALLEEKPRSIYKHEPLRYKIFYFMFKIFPTNFVDWLTEKFVSMPTYEGPNEN